MMAQDPYHTRPGDAQKPERPLEQGIYDAETFLPGDVQERAKPPRQERRWPIPAWLEAVVEVVVDLVGELLD